MDPCAITRGHETSNRYYGLAGVTDWFGDRAARSGKTSMATLAFRTSDSPEAGPDRGAFLRFLDTLAETYMRQSHRVISRAQPLNATMTGVNQPSSGNERSSISP